MAKARKVFGFGNHDGTFYRDWAKWISKGDAWPYDPEMGDCPIARLYVSYTIKNLHSAVQALLDIDRRGDCPRSYDAAKQFLLSLGFPTFTCGQEAFCEKALIFLTEQEKAHEKDREALAAAEAKEREVDVSDLVRPRDGLVVY